MFVPPILFVTKSIKLLTLLVKPTDHNIIYYCPLNNADTKYCLSPHMPQPLLPDFCTTKTLAIYKPWYTWAVYTGGGLFTFCFNTVYNKFFVVLLKVIICYILCFLIIYINNYIYNVVVW